MKKSFCIIILLLSMIPFSGAQSENDNIVLPQTVIDGDTLPEIIF